MPWYSFLRGRGSYQYGPLSIDSTVDDDVITGDDTSQSQRCIHCSPPTCCKNKHCLTIASAVWLLLVLICGCGVTAYLLLVSNIVIDKSIKAFSIPNHESSRRADALEVAMHAYNQPNMHIMTKRDLHGDTKHLQHQFLQLQKQQQTRNDSTKHRRWKRAPYSKDGSVFTLSRNSLENSRFQVMIFKFLGCDYTFKVLMTFP